MKKISFSYLMTVLVILLSCGKNKDTEPDTGNNGGGNNQQNTSCVLTTISQVNSGAGAESSLSAFYNSNNNVTSLVVYDSVNRAKSFEASFSYITADSVRISPYQYLRLDGNKRVIRFVTKSDLSDPAHADTYVFEYSYNSDGYLAKKDLFINGSTRANFSTAYTYANQQLTGCLMTTPSAGNQKVLESTLSYDSKTTIKNWMYTFPDAMEGYPYLTVLNFGKHVVNPLSKVVTKIYNPASGVLLDTWTTSYDNYQTDANGHVLSGVATGDLQQGIASFYGKTNFYYTCH
ncbi:hypothetical protein OCK74_17360 [Chitinophagaceae bacterium LB-8]|uniref:DUF4595 domain-containing protein n=1 Tax=Paraflavisolibacter caeni TaxID=2982496 RepID=A0A9X2XYD6_9BACT|nr:hypothetical protein [Paraflavisolibacter caeni]MCU7550892.1 hypothetical protein [Paraflavisolibacter caeni]